MLFSRIINLCPQIIISYVRNRISFKLISDSFAWNIRSFKWNNIQYAPIIISFTQLIKLCIRNILCEIKIMNVLNIPPYKRA